MSTLPLHPSPSLWKILAQKLEGRTQENYMHMDMETTKGQKKVLGMLLSPLVTSARPQQGVAQIDPSWKTLPPIGGLPWYHLAQEWLQTML